MESRIALLVALWLSGVGGVLASEPHHNSDRDRVAPGRLPPVQGPGYLPESGSYVPPYNPAPGSPYAPYSRPSLTLLPNVGTLQSVGVQVWAAIDEDGSFPGAYPSHGATGRLHDGMSPVTVTSVGSGLGMRPSAPETSYMGLYPMTSPRPQLLPSTDAFGLPAPDLRLAASIPANSMTSIKIDPDRLMSTPVAYHTEGASLQEILRNLVPASYRVSFDVEPGLLDKKHRVTLEKPLSDALLAISNLAGVTITPYHTLQVLLVTEHRDALR